MNLKTAKIWVEEIKTVAGDEEAAHSKEDALYLCFVEHVAITGPKDLAAIARVILKTQELDFSRWYA